MSTTFPTAQEIQSLLDKGAYTPDTIETFEKYVDAQFSGSVEYHYNANRTLTKLYQFFPDRANPAKLARILTLAVIQFPKSHVLTLTCLIPEATQATQPMATIIRCYDLLDACKFQDFWTLWKELEGSYSDLKTLIQPDQSLRQGILDVLARCYRAAPMPVVLTALNLESLDPSSYPNQIESLTETEAVFVATADNTKRTRVFQEGLKFSAISTFVAASQ